MIPVYFVALGNMAWSVPKYHERQVISVFIIQKLMFILITIISKMIKDNIKFVLKLKETFKYLITTYMKKKILGNISLE